MGKYSWVWEYFDELGDEARCKLCTSVLKTNHSTSSLNKHLFLKHRMKRKEDCNVSSTENGSLNQNINEPVSPEASSSFRGTTHPAKLRKTFTNAERSEEIFEALTKMIVVDNLPISFVAGEGYRDFMSTLEPAFVIPSESMLESRLQLQYSATESQIEYHLGEAKYVALSTDCWSANAHAAYITVKAHFIDTEWKENVCTLSTVALEAGDTPFDVDVRLREIADAWNIKEKVVAIVTDNTTDMEAAVRKCGFVKFSSGLTCAAHTLHLCVTQALQDPEIADIFEKVSKLVRFLQYSTATTRELNAGDMSELRLSTPDNWSSMYFMLKSVVEGKAAIQAFLNDQNDESSFNESPSNSEWKVLEEFLSLLEPLQLATTTFTGLESPTSLVSPIINSIVNLHYCKSEQMSESTDRDLPSLFKNSIRKLLIKNFKLSDGEPVETRQLAAFLDPRFKDMLHETQKGKIEIISALRALINSTSDGKACTSPTTTEDCKLKVKMMDWLLGKMYNPQEPTNEVDGYLGEMQISHNTCPLSWWKDHAKKYPELANLARKLLCIPAASAASERVFSTTGDVVLAKRGALNPRNVDMLVFLNQNKDIQ